MVKMLSLFSLAFFGTLGLGMDGKGDPYDSKRYICLSISTDTFINKLKNEEAQHAPLALDETLAQLLSGFENILVGLNAYQEGRLPEALVCFKEAAKLPAMVEAKYLAGAMLSESTGCHTKVNLGHSYLFNAMNKGSHKAYEYLRSSRPKPVNLVSSATDLTFTRPIDWPDVALLNQLVLTLKAWQRGNFAEAFSSLDDLFLKERNQVELDYLLGCSYFLRNRPEWGFHFLKLAEERGYRPATFDLGLRFYLSRNYQSAAYYFSKYSVDPKFQYHLGLTFYKSPSSIDREHALKLIRRAAKDNYHLAVHACSEAEIIFLED